MPRFMLGTYISSYIMKRSDQTLLARLAAEPVGEICISVISKSELLFGVEISPRRQQNQTALNDFLRAIEVLEFPSEAAVHYAQIHAHLRARGTMIGPNDLLLPRTPGVWG